METASSAVVSSRSIQNEANREELISRLFQILFCCNMFMCYGYTYFTASNSWIMLGTHIMAITFHFFPKARDNNSKGMSLIFEPWTTYIKEAFPLSTSSSVKASYNAGVDFNDTILSLFVLTPLRVYSSGDNKGVLYLYFSLASIYPLLVTRWSYLLGGLIWGCVIHSPLFVSAVSWVDIWSIFASSVLYTLCCLWFSTQNKACKTANEAKNTFLSNIGHEVRTPLHGIMGSIDALRSEVERITMGNREANKTLEWLDVMHGCSVSLSEILDNMILLSKLDSNANIVKGSPVKEEFAIRPFMKEIANLAFAYPKAQTVRFQYVVNPDVPALCYTDRIGLRQVVINMVTNGLKFTTAGNVVLRVFMSKEHKNVMCFELADTGCGMSEEFMKRIFTPFSQENVGPARSHRGAGLGMFISATIAHRMDASISVVSKKGLGTTMCLSVSQPEWIFDPAQQTSQQLQGSGENRVLPCVLPSHISSQKLSQRRHTVPFVAYRRNSDVAVLVDKETTIQTISPPCSPEAGAHSELKQSLPTIYESDSVRSPMLGSDITRRASGAIIDDYDPSDENGSRSAPPLLPLALIVDDNPVNIKVLTHCLINIGFQITPATSGEQAVELAKRTAYDICFLDVFMPKMNGFETARALRSLPGEHVPRMIVGCSADTRVIAECKAAGMTEFLQKPFKKDALKQTYETLVKLIETKEPKAKGAG